jgi:hypothetical protein
MHHFSVKKIEYQKLEFIINFYFDQFQETYNPEDSDADDDIAKSDTENVESDPNFKPPPTKGSKRKSLPLTNFLQAGTRSLVSQRALANLSTSLIKDLSNIYPEINQEKVPELVIGRSGIRYQQNGMLNSLASQSIPATDAISFGGKIMNTLTSEEFGAGKRRNVLKKIDHITVTDSQNETFIGEFEVESGKGEVVSHQVVVKLNDKGVPIDGIKIVGADLTAANTGWEIGALSLLEEEFLRALHWWICVIHINELPLRHLTASVVGATSGPNAFKSEFGMTLKNISTVPEPASFDKVASRINQNSLSKRSRIYFFYKKNFIIPLLLQNQSGA